MSVLVFFGVSCVLSVVFFLIACYYFSRKHDDKYVIESYSKVDVVKVLLGCVFWWITLVVAVNRFWNTVTKPVSFVFNFLVGNLGVKNEK